MNLCLLNNDKEKNMAKKCASCNKIYGDQMLYCPECGKKLEEQRVIQDMTQKPAGGASGGNFDLQVLLHTLLYDYGAILAAVLGFLFTWYWDCVIGMIVSGSVLYVLYFQKEKAQIFKATGIAKILAIINVILSVIVLFI